MLWKNLTHEDLELDPEQWGWKLDGATLTPVMTDMAAAPETLLKFVRCFLLEIHVQLIYAYYYSMTHNIIEIFSNECLLLFLCFESMESFSSENIDWTFKSVSSGMEACSASVTSFLTFSSIFCNSTFVSSTTPLVAYCVSFLPSLVFKIYFAPIILAVSNVVFAESMSSDSQVGVLEEHVSSSSSGGSIIA